MRCSKKHGRTNSIVSLGVDVLNAANGRLSGQPAGWRRVSEQYAVSRGMSLFLATKTGRGIANWPNRPRGPPKQDHPKRSPVWNETRPIEPGMESPVAVAVYRPLDGLIEAYIRLLCYNWRKNKRVWTVGPKKKATGGFGARLPGYGLSRDLLLVGCCRRGVDAAPKEQRRRYMGPPGHTRLPAASRQFGALKMTVSGTNGNTANGKIHQRANCSKSSVCVVYNCLEKELRAFVVS